MRVALVVTDLQPGGTPLRLARLAKRLRTARVDVHVGCLAPPGPLSVDLESAGVPTFAAGARSGRDWGAIGRLQAELTRLRPDLIHSTLTHANVVCRWIGRRLGVPVLTSTATIEVERPWHVRLERWTRGWDAGHLVNSTAVAEHVHRAFGVPRERIHQLPPSVDHWPERLDRDESRRQFGLPPAAFVILWAGRFDPVKRVDILLRSLPSLPSKMVLVLAGEGAMRPAIERDVTKMGLADRVRLIGWQANLSAVLSAADLFAFPSRTEGMPNAVLAAMAAALPIVASDIPAHRELAGPEGRLRLVSDEIEDWTGVFKDLFVNAAARERLREQAGAWARSNLDSEKTVAALLSIYERIRGRR